MYGELLIAAELLLSCRLHSIIDALCGYVTAESRFAGICLVRQ